MLNKVANAECANRERFQTQEDAQCSCEAFHAEKIVTIGRNSNNVHHLLLLTSIASELKRIVVR